MADKVIVLLLGILLLLCTIQDLINKRVFLWVIGVGAILTVVCLFFMERPDLLNRIAGFSVGLTILFLSKITAGKIGMGDGLILCVTGLGLGFWCNLELFGLALFLAAMLSILLLILRIVDRKQSIPFIPFLFTGYLILFVASKGAMV